MQIFTDNDLSQHHSLAVQAQAKYFVISKSVADLQDLIQDPIWQVEPKYILGAGSNTLFVNNFPGLIIKIEIPGINIHKETANEVILEIGAGINWHRLVEYSLQHGYSGLENLSLIPGTVGAAPIQNIGAYGVELKDVFVSLAGFNTLTKRIENFNNHECDFAYRDSIFKRALKNTIIITTIKLRLQKNAKCNISYKALNEYLTENKISKLDPRTISDAEIAIRTAKLPDPKVLANAGSFFKNPMIANQKFLELKQEHPDIQHYATADEIKIPAAWLIEQCGWKGKKINHAGMHAQQALVLINYGAASGSELLQLAKTVQADVFAKFKIKLIPEVNIINFST